MRPKVSVILPVYNVEKYLDRCVKSLLNQTLSEIELILVDDGSPDNSPAICDGYAQQDNRVKVIHQKNRGAGMARNTGLGIASGEYLSFIDSDDFVEVDMLEKMYKLANERKLDAVGCGVTIVDSEMNVLNKDYYYPEYKEITTNTECRDLVLKTIRGDKKKIDDTYRQRFRWAVWGYLLKADLFRQHDIRFLSEREIFSEDLSVNIQFFIHASRVGFIPDMLIFHCHNAESLTATRSKLTDGRLYTRQFKWMHSQLNSNTFSKASYWMICEWTIKMLMFNVMRIANTNMSYSQKIERIKMFCTDKDIMSLLRETVDYRIHPFRKRFFFHAITLNIPHLALFSCSFHNNLSS